MSDSCPCKMRLKSLGLFVITLSLPAFLACNTDGDQHSSTTNALLGGEQQKLQASDKQSYDQFGSKMALSSDGNTAIIGSSGRSDSGLTRNGAAYVFVRGGNTWTEQSKLLASDADSEDGFGSSVAISGDGNTVLIGTPRSGDLGMYDGAAYLYDRSGSTWSEQKLVASDRAAANYFGSGVGLSSDGNLALIGASGKGYTGAVYVFVRSGTTWTEQHTFYGSDAASGDSFGATVVLSADGSTALIHAPGKSSFSSTGNGLTYMFARSGSMWIEQSRSGGSGDFSGYGVSLALSTDGNIALIGSPGSTGGAIISGTAYFSLRSGTNWNYGQGFARVGRFGSAVSLSSDGSTAISGAPFYYEGAVFIYGRNLGTWSQQGLIRASDRDSVDLFGTSAVLSADGNTALIGARTKGPIGSGEMGAVYVFGPGKVNGDSCAAGKECLSGFCTDGVCCDTVCGGSNDADCQACSTAAGAPTAGTCVMLSTARMCRASTGPDDPAEMCSGTKPQCPYDVRSSTTMNQAPDAGSGEDDGGPTLDGEMATGCSYTTYGRAQRDLANPITNPLCFLAPLLFAFLTLLHRRRYRSI